MSTLVVTCVIETLCYGTPLHGEVLVVVERSSLVDTPAHRAMVDDDVVAIASPERISTIVNIYGIATANAYETNDYVVCLVLQSVVAECDTITRGCLSFNSYITIFIVRLLFNAIVPETSNTIILLPDVFCKA